MIGKSLSVRSAPDHLTAETVRDTEPGASRVASSSHASGDAPDAGPAAGLGRELLLGGELLCPLPPLFPSAYAGTAMASASAPTITSGTRAKATVTGRRRDS